MSMAEVLAELDRLTPAELAEVQAKLDELAGEAWHDHADLTDSDKSVLEHALADYQASPDVGSPWDQVKERIQSKLRP